MGINGYRIGPLRITEPFPAGRHCIEIPIFGFRQSDLHLAGAGSGGVIHKGGVHQERGLLFRPAGNQHGTVLLKLGGHTVGVQLKAERFQGALFFYDNIFFQVVPHQPVFEADVGLRLIKRLGFHLFRLLHGFIGLFDFLLRRDSPGERPGCRFYGAHAVSDLDISARRSRSRRFLWRSSQNSAVGRRFHMTVFIRQIGQADRIFVLRDNDRLAGGKILRKGNLKRVVRIGIVSFAVNRDFLQIVVDLKKFSGFLIFIMDRDRIPRRQIPAVLQAEIFDGLFPQRGILP